MRLDKHINLKTGLMALALATASGLLAGTATAAMDGYGHEEHGDYMKNVEDRMSRAEKDFNDMPSEDIDSDLETAWEDARNEWEELNEATEENWDEAKAEMDSAWDDFQKEWDENFSEKEE